MLRLLPILLLAGCPMSSGGECELDSQCSGGEVCARDKSCTPAGDVREVTTTWTVRGAPADVNSCATHPDLFINFIGRDHADSLAYAPVPCRIGQFFIDKLPSRFREVELGVEGGASRTRSISGNTVSIDL